MLFARFGQFDVSHALLLKPVPVRIARRKIYSPTIHDGTPELTQTPLTYVRRFVLDHRLQQLMEERGPITAHIEGLEAHIRGMYDELVSGCGNYANNIAYADPHGEGNLGASRNKGQR